MRRTLLLLTLLGWAFAAGAANVKAVRLWPSPDYSRIAIELSESIGFKHFMLRNPDRLVVDLEGVEPEAALTGASAAINPKDPLIANLRAAINRPGVTRLVVELKAETRPQVFTLKPMGEYGYRLVMDLYPVVAPGIDQQVETAIVKAGEGPAATPGGGKEPLPVATQPKPVQAQDARAAAPADATPVKPSRPEYVRLITIAVDAGHGGEDPGARGAKGSREKDITLSIARRLKATIDRQPNMRAYLTRDGDYFIPLHDRVNKARRVQADLFVSIHADAFNRANARGSSVFALSEKGATSAAAKWLAKRENEADLIGGINIDVKDVYLKQTLIDLSQTAQIADSLKLGRAVLDSLGNINDLHKGAVEQAGFAVLKAPDIPSILVETAFISNPDEEARLRDEAYQEKLANSILKGIKAYFARNPPLAKSKMAAISAHEIWQA